MSGLSVAAALQQARAAGVDRLDAQLLLARLLDRPRSWLMAHDDAVLDDPGVLARWRSWLVRRSAGEPLAYLLGEKEFHGLRFDVNPAVLVPRPDTEVLVGWALELLGAEVPDDAEVVDLGTGSGAIALAVKHARPAARVTATDLSEAALDVARHNAAHHSIEIEWQQGPWWQPLGGRRFDLALSNPPYIAGDDPHLAALHHEPALALTPGGDGLAALAAIIGGAPAHLRPGGWLLVEHGYDQARAVRALFGAAGCTDIATRHDLGGQPRCTGGRRP